MARATTSLPVPLSPVMTTLAFLIIDSLVGSWLLRSQGRQAWRRFSETLAAGRPPAREVIDGGLILLGGAFLLTPGFLTDLLGLALLLPPSRAVVRRVLAKPEVTIQSIYGALSAYLIIGLMFAACYAAFEHVGQQDFFANNQPANTQTFQYFSFTTLTTLGYGDFTAAGSGGRSIAVMEALTGQVFLATLVARLVSAYRAPDRPLPEDVDRPGDDEDGD